MPWELVVRTDSLKKSEDPIVSIRTAHIAFNVTLCKKAGVQTGKRVKIWADPENLKLGFEIVEGSDKENSFSLSQSSPDPKGKKFSGFFCSGSGIYKKYSWVKTIANARSSMQNQFPASKEGKYWVIQLCPGFEKSAKSDKEILSKAVGVYRYLRNGEVVYIGRGPVRGRLQEAQRKDWNFDTIEYSIVKTPEEQKKWEDYWIRKHEEENNGNLPTYNKIRASQDGNQA